MEAGSIDGRDVSGEGNFKQEEAVLYFFFFSLDKYGLNFFFFFEGRAFYFFIHF